MPNRLAMETSPYLLQHKNNPVDWYPWGEEALSRARKENKPILLSIGYSACHWCHVMERESFENPATAALMNENFINIKVDREERPDLDRIYQNVAQALTRSGGWPLTVFLRPDLKPFYGGTYFPPVDGYGRPGFPRVLSALSQAYHAQPEDVAENSTRLVEYIQQVEGIRAGAGVQDQPLGIEELLHAAGRELEVVDWTHGGLGGAPKFPNPMSLAFLWRVAALKGSDSEIPQKAGEAVLLTLEKMACGGIYDQLGGGFHRYSVDPTWSVPHFEKMLYDNGLLLQLYSEVLLTADVTGVSLSAFRRALFKRVIAETVQYLLREMRSPEGGFFAAQDADSEGEEGAYFAWRPEDLSRFLTPEEAKAASLAFGIDERGNFEEGKTVLFLSRDPSEVGKELFFRVRKKMFEARKRRVAPDTDRKLLASWNGLVISGLAWASRALEENGEAALAKAASEAATGAFGWARTKLARPDGRLWSTYQAGKARFNAYLDDYAFLARAGLDLARFSKRSGELERYLEASLSWVRTILKNFSDASGAPGFFFTSDDHESLIHRTKSVEDQAIPSGTAVALQCFTVLREMDPLALGAELGPKLEKQLSSFASTLKRSPFGYGELLCASLLFAEGPVVVSGKGADHVIFHPHVFQKAAASGGEGERLLLCHQQVCEALEEPVRERIVSKLLPKA